MTISAKKLAANRDNGLLGGRPKGSKNWQTLAEDLVREETRKKVSAGLGPILTVQMAHAQGIGHLYRRDKKGRYSRIEDQAQIDAIVAKGLKKDRDGGTYYIFAKDPSVHAFVELMNRALGKPKQPVDVNVTGRVDIVATLQLARDRLAKARAAGRLGPSLAPEAVKGEGPS